MYTMVASYQEPSELPEEILINKQNTKIIAWKQNTPTTYYQSIAATQIKQIIMTHFIIIMQLLCSRVLMSSKVLQAIIYY